MPYRVPIIRLIIHCLQIVIKHWVDAAEVAQRCDELGALGLLLVAEISLVMVISAVFLPRVDLNSKPDKRTSGFQEFGLPVAADAGITRYLAAFLSTHRVAGLEPQRGPVPDTE